jgi:hypothetical protein
MNTAERLSLGPTDGEPVCDRVDPWRTNSGSASNTPPSTLWHTSPSCTHVPATILPSRVTYRCHPAKPERQILAARGHSQVSVPAVDKREIHALVEIIELGSILGYSNTLSLASGPIHGNAQPMPRPPGHQVPGIVRRAIIARPVGGLGRKAARASEWQPSATADHQIDTSAPNSGHICRLP